MNDVSSYDFDLPPELIAQSPLADRGAGRLMVVDRAEQTIRHFHVRDLPLFLNPSDSLVVNDTKVVPARLIGNRSRTGGTWEGLFLGLTPEGNWKIMGKTRGKLTPGETIALRTAEGNYGFPLELLEKTDDGNWIVRARTDEDPFTALEQVGWIPIPPYIRGGRMSPEDRTDYQTLFASRPGAIAAPTAGLHFDNELLDTLRSKGIPVLTLTLHVGIGTFRPISVTSLDDHQMHSEWGTLSRETAEELNRRRASGGRTVAVGTTSVRVLESSAAPDGTLTPFAGETDLFIRPVYAFRAVDVLLTNFHFPKSTLYVLVRTFGGDALIRQAYEEAVREKYRFFSYGDAMLIL